MRKPGSHILILIIALFIFAAFTGCGKENNSENTFGLEQFENAMKDKGYLFEIEDARQDFLQATRKRMVFDENAIDIYLFKNNKKAEEEAGRISSDGCSYTNGSRTVTVSWISYPHFYKKGSLIVQYVGEDEKIISDLKEILGGQFAGYVP